VLDIVPASCDFNQHSACPMVESFQTSVKK
jgi:hypothetical protein